MAAGRIKSAWRRWTASPRRRAELDGGLLEASKAGDVAALSRLADLGARPSSRGFCPLESTFYFLGYAHPASDWLFERFPSGFGDGFALAKAMELGGGRWAEALLERFAGTKPPFGRDGPFAYMLAKGFLAARARDPELAIQWLERATARRPQELPQLCGDFAAHGAEEMLTHALELAAAAGLARVASISALRQFAMGRGFFQGRPWGMPELSEAMVRRLVAAAPAAEARWARVVGHACGALRAAAGERLGADLFPRPGVHGSWICHAMRSDARHPAARGAQAYLGQSDAILDEAPPEALWRAALEMANDCLLSGVAGEASKSRLEALASRLPPARAQAAWRRAGVDPRAVPAHHARMEAWELGEAVPGEAPRGGAAKRL